MLGGTGGDRAFVQRYFESSGRREVITRGIPGYCARLFLGRLLCDGEGRFKNREHVKPWASGRSCSSASTAIFGVPPALVGNGFLASDVGYGFTGAEADEFVPFCVLWSGGDVKAGDRIVASELEAWGHSLAGHGEYGEWRPDSGTENEVPPNLCRFMTLSRFGHQSAPAPLCTKTDAWAVGIAFAPVGYLGLLNENARANARAGAAGRRAAKAGRRERKAREAALAAAYAHDAEAYADA